MSALSQIGNGWGMEDRVMIQNCPEMEFRHSGTCRGPGRVALELSLPELRFPRGQVAERGTRKG